MPSCRRRDVERRRAAGGAARCESRLLHPQRLGALCDRSGPHAVLVRRHGLGARHPPRHSPDGVGAFSVRDRRADPAAFPVAATTRADAGHPAALEADAGARCNAARYRSGTTLHRASHDNGDQRGPDRRDAARGHHGARLASAAQRDHPSPRRGSAHRPDRRFGHHHAGGACGAARSQPGDRRSVDATRRHQFFSLCRVDHEVRA